MRESVSFYQTSKSVDESGIFARQANNAATHNSHPVLQTLS